MHCISNLKVHVGILRQAILVMTFRIVRKRGFAQTVRRAINRGLTTQNLFQKLEISGGLLHAYFTGKLGSSRVNFVFHANFTRFHAHVVFGVSFVIHEHWNSLFVLS